MINCAGGKFVTGGSVLSTMRRNVRRQQYWQPHACDIYQRTRGHDDARPLTRSNDTEDIALICQSRALLGVK